MSNQGTSDLSLKVGKKEVEISPETKFITSDGIDVAGSDGQTAVGVSVAGDHNNSSANVEVTQPLTPSEEEDCDSCVYAFSSSVPGSRVYIGRGALVDGCRFDGFITFAATGQPKPNPLKRDELIYPVGIFATRDKELAKKLQAPLDCGISVAYKRYIPEMDAEMMAATGIN